MSAENAAGGGGEKSAVTEPSVSSMEKAAKILEPRDSAPWPAGRWAYTMQEIASALDAALLDGAQRERDFVIGLIEHDANLDLNAIRAILVVRHRERAEVPPPRSIPFLGTYPPGMFGGSPSPSKPPSIRATIEADSAAAAFWEARERQDLGDPTAPSLPPMPPVELGKSAGGAGALFTTNPLAASSFVANPLATQSAVDALKLRLLEHCNGTYCVARLVHESVHCGCSCPACARAMRARPRA